MKTKLIAPNVLRVSRTKGDFMDHDYFLIDTKDERQKKCLEMILSTDEELRELAIPLIVEICTPFLAYTIRDEKRYNI